MSVEDDINTLLKNDLKMELGLALRYLFLVNKFKDINQLGVSQTLYELASDCITHNDTVRRILKERGLVPEDTFTRFKVDFEDLDLALKSSFYLENRMAKEYSEMAAQVGADHTLYTTFVNLAQWESWHMFQVLAAMEMLEKSKELPTVDDQRDALVKKMEELETRNMEIEEDRKLELLKPPGAPRKRLKVESLLAKAMEKRHELETMKLPPAPDGALVPVDDEGSISALGEHIDLNEIGTPAESVMDKDVEQAVFGEDKEKEYYAYCFKCNGKYTIKDITHVVIAGDKPSVKGRCSNCNFPVISLDI